MAAIDFKDQLLSGLGGPFPASGPLNPIVIKTEQKAGYTLKWIKYEGDPGELIPAILMIPDGVDSLNPAPGVCIWHQHNGQWDIGKTEPAGLSGNPMHHTGVSLVENGYVVLCPDALGFEERTQGYKLTAGSLERFLYLKYVVRGQTMAWKNILDMRRAVDYLTSLEEVDSNSIGSYGHSMGSTHAYMVAPWEPRIKATVCNCCLPTYKAIEENEILHCFPNFVTGIYPEADTPDIVALIAPRPVHMNFGELDSGSPIKHVRNAMANIRMAYESMHAEDNFTYYIESGAGHILSEEMWTRGLNFFDRHLKR
ncbi:MAG: dienelactone hydrolase family protein [Pirellulales bacterium]|nr:dienelactone hydrolase family protein [Pirellulales bacterium]